MIPLIWLAGESWVTKPVSTTRQKSAELGTNCGFGNWSPIWLAGESWVTKPVSTMWQKSICI
ncbi:hypothetical protein GBP18_01810 [Pediococcus acidilactici]|nr:hypothetical protein GBP18_01810 [Pediococcus acidilactici]